MRTKQEWFSNAYRYHIIEDNDFGVNPDTERCSYTGGCAIGCQLSPESMETIRAEGFEGLTASSLANSLREMKGASEAELEFINALQVAHDEAYESIAVRKIPTSSRYPSFEDVEYDKGVLKFNYEQVAAFYELEVPSE
jgi:hypothetical protein